MVLSEFLKYKKAYGKLTAAEEKENFAREKSIATGAAIGRIRNHSIGTLLVNISEGMELDTAVKKYEQIVAPANYKRPKAIYTKKGLPGVVVHAFNPSTLEREGGISVRSRPARATL